MAVKVIVLLVVRKFLIKMWISLMELGLNFGLLKLECVKGNSLRGLLACEPFKPEVITRILFRLGFVERNCCPIIVVAFVPSILM